MIRLDDFLKVKRKWKSALDNFVKVKMHDTFRQRKNNSMQLVQVRDFTSSNLRHEIENLERLVTQRLGKVKAAMQAGEAIVIQESRQAEQLATNLKTDIAMLRANLKEAEEAFATRDLARQKIEESLNAKIKSFHGEITNKEALLVARENEITGYKLKISKTEEEAASNAKCAEDVAQNTLAKVTVLQAKLKATEELANYQESSIQELKNELDAKAQELDSMVKDKQDLLIRRDSEINDLKSQLKRLTTGISEMSSFFRQAGALNDIEAQVQNDMTAGVEEKVAAVQPHISTKHIASPAVGEIAGPEIFQRIITEFSEATNMIDTLASLIVQQQVKALGESVETFPRTRLPELIECLAKDIEDEKRQIDFRQRCNQKAHLKLN